MNNRMIFPRLEINHPPVQWRGVRRKGSGKDGNFRKEMNAGCVMVDEALNNLIEFLCIGMGRRKHLTEVLRLKGPSDKNEDLSAAISKSR